jgi:hypothetical protein
MRKAPRGGRFREVAPAGGEEINRTQPSAMLANGFSSDVVPEAKASSILGGGTPDRSKLFGSTARGRGFMSSGGSDRRLGKCRPGAASWGGVVSRV